MRKIIEIRKESHTHIELDRDDVAFVYLIGILMATIGVILQYRESPFPVLIAVFIVMWVAGSSVAYAILWLFGLLFVKGKIVDMEENEMVKL